MKKQTLVALLFFFIVVLTICVWFLIKSNHYVNFDNQKFTLKYARVLQNENYILNEYTPKNEPIENWTSLLSVNYYPNSRESLAYLSDSHISGLQKNYGDKLKILADNDKGNVIVKAFIIVNRNYTEYDAICYTKHKGGYYYLHFIKKYRYSNINELKEQSMKLLRENQKYLGLIEAKTLNFRPEPLYIEYGK